MAAPAFGQTAKPAKPKKGEKPPVTAPAETAPAPAPAPTEAAAAPAVAPEATAAPAPAPAAAATPEPPKDDWDITDVYEKPATTYYFVGLGYRGTIIPKFMLNLFIDEGKSVYSNSIGVEFDIRKDGFSLIPSISYNEYSVQDMLVKEKSKPEVPENYSVINSSLKAIFASADLLWSTPISKKVDFEYGAGFGLGVVFGDLGINWVYEKPGGPYAASTGKQYAPCQTVNDGRGCSPSNHTNPEPVKINGYTEPSWVNGGSKPNIFPQISIPEIGIRYKPIKQLETRIGVGFSLTGFFFGIRGAYGLEKRPTPSVSGPSEKL